MKERPLSRDERIKCVRACMDEHELAAKACMAAGDREGAGEHRAVARNLFGMIGRL